MLCLTKKMLFKCYFLIIITVFTEQTGIVHRTNTTVVNRWQNTHLFIVCKIKKYLGSCKILDLPAS